LTKQGYTNIIFLDGEELRKRLDRKYGYTPSERFAVFENIIRVVNECHDEGNAVIVSTISHKKVMREIAREKCKNFIEVFLDCPAEICAKRDYKDNYRKAYAGNLDNFIGVTEPYEKSDNPDLIINTALLNAEECEKKLYKKVIDSLE